MGISAKLTKAINEQITEEYQSAYTYESMAYKLESMNLVVFAKWFRIQAAEEREHAERFSKYLLDRGEEVVLKALAAPKGTWKSCLAICEAALRSEIVITEKIDDLVNLASKEKDNTTYSFLLWFVNEQVEEEANAKFLLDLIKLATKPAQALMLEGRVRRLIEERTG
ncbi:MAG: ferritin [candidate division Zixibacteria bacterium]|nr:ferritin [candidate division Zixibacteria bacterium]